MPTRKRGPELPQTHHRYLHPQIVPHIPGGSPVPPRNQIWHVTPKAAKSITKLQIRELPDGRFEIPRRHLNVLDATLDCEATQTYRDINAAMRSMGMHIPHQVRAETKRMHLLYNELRQYHGISNDHWNRMNSTQRAMLVRKIRTSIRHLAENPDLMRSELKQAAYDRLDRVADLFEQRNPTAAITTLGAASRDVLQRFNELLAQRVYLPRRERSIREMKTRREAAIFAGLRELAHEFGRAGRLSGSSAADQRRLNRTIANWQRYFEHPNRNKIGLFAGAANDLGKARALAGQGRYREMQEPLREANKKIALEISKTADLYGDLIAIVGQSRDADWKKQIMKNQAQLIAENIEFWTRRGFPEGFGDWPGRGAPVRPQTVSDFFLNWARVAEGIKRKDIARAFIRARTAYNNRQSESCSKIMENLAEKLAA
jgi:hypothetical protein